MAKFITTTIAEQFPVFFSHVNYDPANPGPFYAPNSKWYDIDNDKNRQFVEFRAKHLRQRGFTVTVDFPK